MTRSIRERTVGGETCTKPMLRDETLMAMETRGGTVEALIRARSQGPPPEAWLHEAAGLFEETVPAEVLRAAQWLHISDELSRNGFDEAAIIRVFVSAFTGLPPRCAPSVAVFAPLIDRHPECARTIAEETYEQWIELLVEVPLIEFSLSMLMSTCAGSVATNAVPPPEWDECLTHSAPVESVRAVLQSVDEERRDALLIRWIGPPPPSPRTELLRMSAVTSLIDLAGPAAKAQFAERIDAMRGDPTLAALVARADAGGGPLSPDDRPTESATRALAHLLRDSARRRKTQSIGEVAQRHHDRAVPVSAPELRSMPEWCAADERRRQQIAGEVAEAAGISCTGFLDAAAGPIAQFEAAGVVYCLVPGGTFHRGLSAREAQLLRARYEAGAPPGEDPAALKHLLEVQAARLRPVERVSIAPLLVATGCALRMAPSDVTRWLEGSRFRLPSEAEWEYLARGGREGQLTWRGDEVPNETWLESTAGERRGHPFGLKDLGLYPELCADAWRLTYTGAPLDGSPVWGDGPRVTRGGALLAHPWQGIGEWIYMLSAARESAEPWEFEVGIRPVLSVLDTPSP